MELISRVYPSYPLPGIDADAWELAAWDDLCDLLRKNKTKIGNPRIRADLTGSGPIAHPDRRLRQLRDDVPGSPSPGPRNRAGPPSSTS